MGPQKTLTIEPLTQTVDAIVRVVGSKSYTNRALVIAALAGGQSLLSGALDIGGTLVRYNKPLNWQSLCREALEQVCVRCQLPAEDVSLLRAESVLRHYNTREHPREHEVESSLIFGEVLDVWNAPPVLIENAKEAFYGYFQRDAVCYEDTLPILTWLRAKQLRIGGLTDVAYGMDNRFALRDIAPIQPYFDSLLTSNDVGYRKPHPSGYKMLLDELTVSPDELLFVGDEEKDVAGAGRLGIRSVLIDRERSQVNWGQDATVHSLQELPQLI